MLKKLKLELMNEGLIFTSKRLINHYEHFYLKDLDEEDDRQLIDLFDRMHAISLGLDYTDHELLAYDMGYYDASEGREALLNDLELKVKNGKIYPSAKNKYTDEQLSFIDQVIQQAVDLSNKVNKISVKHSADNTSSLKDTLLDTIEDYYQAYSDNSYQEEDYEDDDESKEEGGMTAKDKFEYDTHQRIKQYKMIKDIIHNL